VCCRPAPQPLFDLVDDPLSDLDINEIRGPLVWASRTRIVVPADGPRGPITATAVLMTTPTPKDHPSDEWRVTRPVGGDGDEVQ
jgi:hypothetical protein